MRFRSSLSSEWRRQITMWQRWQMTDGKCLTKKDLFMFCEDTMGPVLHLGVTLSWSAVCVLQAACQSQGGLLKRPFLQDHQMLPKDCSNVEDRQKSSKDKLTIFKDAPRHSTPLQSAPITCTCFPQDLSHFNPQSTASPDWLYRPCSIDPACSWPVCFTCTLGKKIQPSAWSLLWTVCWWSCQRRGVWSLSLSCETCYSLQSPRPWDTLPVY